MPVAGGTVSRVAGASAPTHGRGLRCGRVHSARPGTCRRGRGRSTPSGTGILSPNAWAVPGWSGPHPAARNVPADIWDAVVRGRRGSARSVPVPPVPGGGGAREPGWKTWDARGAHPRKILTSDKPDLFLVHLRSVQGSGILRGNRSTSYSGRRISDRSGRPSVAFRQSNRQGRSRAPSSGQVRDDVSRGDQGASGR